MQAPLLTCISVLPKQLFHLLQVRLNVLQRLPNRFWRSHIDVRFFQQIDTRGLDTLGTKMVNTLKP